MDFRKLSGILFGKGRKPIEESGVSAVERRLQTRYLVGGFDEGLLTARIQGLSFGVEDLSYGGLALNEERCQISAAVGDALEVELSFLGKKIQSSAVLVGRRSAVRMAGLLFEHRDPATLVFLRQYLEPMRWGASLVQLEKTFVNQKFRGDNWYCYRGDGPVDLIAETDGSVDRGTVKSLILTMPLGEHYSELTYRDGLLATGVTRASQGMPGSQMAVNSKLDSDILRSAICVFQLMPGAKFGQFCSCVVKEHLRD